MEISVQVKQLENKVSTLESIVKELQGILDFMIKGLSEDAYDSSIESDIEEDDYDKKKKHWKDSSSKSGIKI